MIKFVTYPVKSVLEINIDQLLTSHMRYLIDIALAHNGYIAGGFALLVARHHMLYNQFDDKWAQFTPERLMNGDIDIWFPDNASYDAYRTEMKNKFDFVSDHFDIEQSKLNTATNYTDVKTRRKIQIIHKYISDRKTNTSCFDIYNAMVSLDHNTITFPAEWIDLEKNKTLHVFNWTCPWVLNRICKYMARKRYKYITPETMLLLKEHVSGIILKIQADKATNSNCKPKANVSNFENALRTANPDAPGMLTLFKDSMSNEDLLYFAAILNTHKMRYDFINKELLTRMTNQASTDCKAASTASGTEEPEETASS